MYTLEAQFPDLLEISLKTLHLSSVCLIFNRDIILFHDLCAGVVASEIEYE